MAGLRWASPLKGRLPDIYIDFPHGRKDDVVDLIFRRCGKEHAAILDGFNTFQGKFSLCGHCEGSRRRKTSNTTLHRNRAIRQRQASLRSSSTEPGVS